MSTEYSADIGIGFDVEPEDLRMVFGKTRLRESHMEERYDPKTGQNVSPVEVVDREETTVLVLPGSDREYEVGRPGDRLEIVGDLEEFLGDLCGLITTNSGATARYALSTVDSFVEAVMIEPSYPTEGDGWDLDALSMPPPVYYRVVRDLDPELKKIGAELTRLGLPVESPVIRVVGSVY